MAFTGPWYIDDVKQHPAKIQRLQTYLSTLGSEGVLGPLDLRPLELTTPGSGIRLTPGGIVIPNRAAGGSYESYSDKSDEDIIVDIEPTTSSGGRSDLVIARVENPYESGGGWIAPADAVNDPYTKPIVVPNVGTSLVDVHDYNAIWSAANICRVDIPTADTATITNDMITDLRWMAKLGGGRVIGIIAQEFVIEIAQGTGSWNTGAPQLNPSDTSFIAWPPASRNIPVPSWATHVTSTTEVKNAHLIGGDTWGEIRMMIDGIAQPVSPIDLNQDVDASGGFRSHLPVPGTFEIEPDQRGSIINFHLESKVYNDPRVTGTLYDDVGTTTVFSLNFKQLPVSA